MSKTPEQMLATAIRISAVAHEEQFDKGGNPYFLHPNKVMHYLHSDDFELKAIAILHDVVEDTEITFQDLQDEGMSNRIIQALMWLTKADRQSYDDYIEGIKSNKDAIRVKLADLRHNMDPRRLKGLENKDFERMEKYQKMYFILKETLEDF